MLEFIVKYWAQWLFGIVAAGLTAAYRNLSKKIKAQKEENKAIKTVCWQFSTTGCIRRVPITSRKGTSTCPV